MHRMAHPEGEAATARGTAMSRIFIGSLFHNYFSSSPLSACVTFNTCMILSSSATASIEDISRLSSNNGLRWFQLYLYKDRSLVQSLVKRAEAAGYKALVLTIDNPVTGKRLNEKRFGFNLPPHLSLANIDVNNTASIVTKERQMKISGYTLSDFGEDLMDSSLSWKDITWLMSITSLPVVVKGVLTAEDARIAVELGVKGILVSNHGARQLDGVPATVSQSTSI